jgi:hypothetical protein
VGIGQWHCWGECKGAKHAKVLELITLFVFCHVPITLFVFCHVPKGPGQKHFEFASSQVAESKVSSLVAVGSDGMDDVVGVIVTDSRGVRGKLLSAKDMDGMEFHRRDMEAVIQVKIGSSGER